MKGHAPTPEAIVDQMVGRLFEARDPLPGDVVIDAGAGDGRFGDGIVRYCERRGLTPPRVLCVELDPVHVAAARQRLAHVPSVEVVQADYLLGTFPRAQFVIGNPPYVGITGLDKNERAAYRDRFKTARGRFDLYILFFERSLELLEPGGRLCFITPEKFTYVETATTLRRLLSNGSHVERIEFVDESTFPGLITFPLITTASRVASKAPTRVHRRDGIDFQATLPSDGASWNGEINRVSPTGGKATFGDLCIRISCGVATGADGVFILKNDEVPSNLQRFAHPTLGGRDLGRDGFESSSSMLVPYDAQGNLLDDVSVAPLAEFLTTRGHVAALRERTCVRDGRPWYRFHDNVPLPDILQPKIIWKDIAPEPRFWPEEGRIVPRHTVYYAVPKPGVSIEALLDYLNGPEARAWIQGHVQRAHNGFYRLQSRVIRDLPVPDDLAHALGPRAAPPRQAKLTVA